ncbi:MAG: hypothetical protein MK082_07305 [Phycisphaerales bacterium]|nr:hypothetical protein [Phycisphaerales bacterium]
MSELIERIRDLPVRTPSRPERVDATGSPQNTLRLSVEELQESLDYLRLSVKYLVFDLEATRRENAYLRRLVEQANRERDRQDPDET